MVADVYHECECCKKLFAWQTVTMEDGKESYICTACYWCVILPAREKMQGVVFDPVHPQPLR